MSNNYPEHITFQKGMGENIITYPLTESQITNLKTCDLINPKVGKCNLKIPKKFDIVKSSFEILKVRLEVTKGIFPRWFMEKYYPYKIEYGKFPSVIPEPLRREGLSFGDPMSLANIVHMDFPMDLGKIIVRYLLSEGVNVKNWNPKFKNFLESVPHIEEQLTDANKRALNKAFEGKYHTGLARPEEILEKITGIKGELFTHYEEGSPNHPSGIFSGHSAVAAATGKCIIKEFNIENLNHLKIILDTCYCWGFFRSLAGVHHWQDNLASFVQFGLKSYMKKEIVNLFEYE